MYYTYKCKTRAEDGLILLFFWALWFYGEIVATMGINCQTAADTLFSKDKRYWKLQKKTCPQNRQPNTWHIANKEVISLNYNIKYPPIYLFLHIQIHMKLYIFVELFLLYSRQSWLYYLSWRPRGRQFWSMKFWGRYISKVLWHYFSSGFKNLIVNFSFFLNLSLRFLV